MNERFEKDAKLHPQLVAIDLDGTLLDSVDDLHAAIVSMQSALELEHSSTSDVRSWIGDGIERLVHRALTTSMTEDAPAQHFQLALKNFRKAYSGINGQYASVYPGVIDGLEWLLERRVPMSIVTNKAREFTLPLLKDKGLECYFSHVVCGDDVAARKPAADSLLRSAELAGASPEASVMIGDSIIDFHAARNASFKLIGVSYGYSGQTAPAQMSVPERPDVIMDSFAQLPDAIQRLFSIRAE